MPCEGCQVQFTVFRRKRCCTECRRYFCSNCLAIIESPTKTSASQLIHGSSSSTLCVRCAIFTKRPLLRNDLLQLKPKDLIFYLQSKRVSTAGCVEKDELIGLVLNHVQKDVDVNGTARTESNNSKRTGERRTPRADEETSSSTPFRSLKQSCQNFFNNITENLQDTFSAFDDTNQTNNSNNNNNININNNTHQNQEKSTPTSPRVSTRVLPTYASVQTTNRLSPTSTPTEESSNHKISTECNNNDNLPSISPTRENVASYTRLDEMCLCSDNEEAEKKEEEEDETAITVEKDSAQNSGKAKSVGKNTTETEINIENAFEENSSQSSFEELGAIGGLSDESISKTPADSNSGIDRSNNLNNLEQCHVLDKHAIAITASTLTNRNPTELTKATACNKLHEEESVAEATTSSNINKVLTVSQIPMGQIPLSKKIARHHSEGHLELHRQWQHMSIGETPSTSGAANGESNSSCDVDDAGSRRESCKRCGKHKTNLKQQIDRMRMQLESVNMSEIDIKRELNEFLEFLESRTKSLDDDDVDNERSAERHSSDFNSSLSFYDDNAGINVYAVPVEDVIEKKQPVPQRRFISLHDFDTIQQLESLTVKQLKEVLMLNRVDYKGCVEKQELFERVERLWKNLKSTPALEQLPTDELCKICMDAPIECVILECGHMATCTNCGKVLSECPICRQYIVRVVRFFRA